MTWSYRKIHLVTISLSSAALVLYLGYSQCLSADARARSLNVHINETKIGEDWFAALSQLAKTTDRPEDYIAYHPPGQHQAWIKQKKVVLAKRLLADKATELVPGLIHILRTTKPALEAGGDREGWIARSAAVFALSEIGGAAKPAMRDLLEVVSRDPDCARNAIRALGNIGDPACTPVLASCLSRDDLQDWDKADAVSAIRRIGSLTTEARSILMRAMLSTAPEGRRHAAICLGYVGESDAAPILVALLREDMPYFEKEEIVAALKCIPKLPDDVVTALEQLERQGEPEVSGCARDVLRHSELRP